MQNRSRSKEKGFIEIIVLIIVGLALLKYFLNWDIFDAASSEEGQGTVTYIREIFSTVWSYIRGPVSYAWNEVVIPILDFGWRSLKALIEWGRSGATN